jgi:hypothetical protein
MDAGRKTEFVEALRYMDPRRAMTHGPGIRSTLDIFHHLHLLLSAYAHAPPLAIARRVIVVLNTSAMILLLLHTYTLRL